MREAVDHALAEYLDGIVDCPQRLTDALQYSVLSAGKRLRPILVLLACEACGGEWRTALPGGCAVEFVHVYSLIHDDLPAMDNDDLRRGIPTSHKKFDEATAILAGDSLQMLAMEVLSHQLPAGVALKCCQALSVAAGRSRLVGGQVDDLAAEGRWGEEARGALALDPLAYLKSIHRRKTGALIVASLEIGATIGGASRAQLDCLTLFGHNIGLAFQIVDDCLDEESTSDQLGKNTHKDGGLGKLTYPGLLGLKESRQMAEQLVSDAIDAIAVLGERKGSLVKLARFVVDRSN